MKLLMNTQQCQKTSRALILKTTHFRLVITTSTNRFQNGWCKSKRLGPGALFRAHWTRVQPLLIDVVPPFADGKDPNYCLQINENVLWEWRTVEGNLKKLYAVLQRNLRLNGYLLEESAFNRVSVLPSTKTKIFVDKIKKENNGKRRGRKKADSVPNRNLSFPVRHLGLPQNRKAPMRITELFDSAEN